MHHYEIKTERLLLRPLTLADADAVWKWVSDERVARYMAYPTYTDKEKLNEWLRFVEEQDDTYEFGFVRLSDGDLRRIFSHRVLVFRDAALALTVRGLDRWTGVAAKEAPLLFNREHDDALDADIPYTPMSGSAAFTARPGAEVLSTLGFRPFAGSPQYDAATPAAVLYANELGGKVLTVQYHANMQMLQRHSEGRKASLLAAIERLAGGPLAAVSAHDQDMLTLVRRAPDGSRLVLAENLNPDPVRELTLLVPPGEACVERLMGDGTWKSVRARRDGRRLVSDVPLAFYEAAVLRLH